MMFSLLGKKCLVTGASSGIGKAISLALYNQGADVVVTGRNKDSLEGLVSECDEKRMHYLIADMNKQEEVDNLVGKASEILGGLDVLVCSAGIVKDNLALRMDKQSWDEVIQTNLSSVFFINQQALKLMFRKKWGRIINITSIVGVSGGAGQANYAASKAGLIAMSKSLAMEVASRNITVNCIAPGFIETPMTEALGEKRKEEITKNIPGNKIGQVSDIASAAVFLASEEASYIRGHTMHINGGLLMI